MSILFKLINNKIKVPYPIGSLLSRIPYSFRPFIGKNYAHSSSDILNWDNFDSNQKHQFIFNRMRKITTYAYKNIPFYNDFYSSQSFDPNNLKKFEDLNKIPIINKEILKKYNLEKRSYHHPKRQQVNTGGSSGEPFSFYIVPRQIGHEWAHMHRIWSSVDYTYSSLKLTFSGRSNLTSKLLYDPIRHHYLIDIYSNHEDHYDEIYSLFLSRSILFFHGYPSAIYEFVLFLQKHHQLLNLVKQNLKAVIFSSEYPNPVIRNHIETVLGVRTYAFYGHTERCILAGEKSKNTYTPLQTYGFTEAVKSDNGYKLIGTSYYNTASPLIRYDTGDLIDKIKTTNSILTTFEISKGRESEYIIDKKNNKISLTGLIFGRHHDLFNYVNYIQIYQKQPGEAIVYCVLKKKTKREISTMFDSKNVLIDFSFEQIKKPVLTQTGKLNLKLFAPPIC